MATCVLLAHKFNHTSLPDSAKTLTKQRDLLDALESYPKGAPRAKILTAEPDVLSALRFALHVPRKDVMYVLFSLSRPLLHPYPPSCPPSCHPSRPPSSPPACRLMRHATPSFCAAHDTRRFVAHASSTRVRALPRFPPLALSRRRPHFYRLLDMMKPRRTALEYLGETMFKRVRHRKVLPGTKSSAAAAAASAAASSTAKPLRSRRLRRSLLRSRRRRERRRQREHQQSRRAALVDEKLRRMDAYALKEHYKFLKQERKLVLAEIQAVEEQLGAGSTLRGSNVAHPIDR